MRCVSTGVRTCVVVVMAIAYEGERTQVRAAEQNLKTGNLCSISALQHFSQGTFFQAQYREEVEGKKKKKAAR